MTNNHEEADPWRWTRYNQMMEAREVVDFDNPDFCQRCGKRKGDHVTDSILKINPRACPFVPKIK